MPDLRLVPQSEPDTDASLVTLLNVLSITNQILLDKCLRYTFQEKKRYAWKAQWVLTLADSAERAMMSVRTLIKESNT